jgi:DNA-binding IclR family transcriptional regulator
MARRGTSSLGKALQVLDAVARLDTGTQPVSVSEVVEFTGLEKSQVSRMLSTFVDHGYIERIGQRKGYRLGWHSYLVGRRAQVSQLSEGVRPVVEQAGRDLGLATYFSILSGIEAVTLVSWEPDHRRYAQTWDGRPFSVLGSAVGAALLVDRTDREVIAHHAAEVALGPSVEPSSDEPAEALVRRVRAVRSEGLARVDNEHGIGISTIAVPVRDRSEESIGVISTTVVLPRLDDGTAARIAERLVDAARRLHDLHSGVAPVGEPA